MEGGQGRGGGSRAKELRGPGCCEVCGQDSDVTPGEAKTLQDLLGVCQV